MSRTQRARPILVAVRAPSRSARALLRKTASLRHPAGDRELQEEFVLADRDRDGRIDFEEFERLMRGLEAGMSATDLRIGFQEIDTDADGLIDFCEFVDWWSAD